MNYLKKFVVRLSGMAEGIQAYEFLVDKKFFDAFEFSDIKDGKVNVVVTADKQDNFTLIHLKFSGYVWVACDRCSEMFRHKLRGSHNLIVKTGSPIENDDEDVIFVSEETHEVNISQHIYELINLLLPIRRLHENSVSEEEQCDEEMIERLENSNQKDKQIDPRWEVLKKLKNKK